jgi:NADP-dependent 3-hydroxy acid dehydrogenase YdfG
VHNRGDPSIAAVIGFRRSGTGETRVGCGSRKQSVACRAPRQYNQVDRCRGAGPVALEGVMAICVGKTPREETALAANLKTALVTGAGSGIGRSIANALAEMGLRVALVGRDREKLERTRAELSKGEDSTFIASCDITDRDAVGSVVRQIEADLGSIDILVCNAGINVRNRSLESLDPADWDRMIATNLTGSFNLVHHVLPSMRRWKGGLVIQICSVSGIRASTLGGAGYSASKFGQSALGICLGREEGPHGIRSSVIYPGEVETPILDARPVPVGSERRSVILQPDDIAAAVKFLVELHPRAHVPELVITPTVDDFC